MKNQKSAVAARRLNKLRIICGIKLINMIYGRDEGGVFMNAVFHFKVNPEKFEFNDFLEFVANVFRIKRCPETITLTCICGATRNSGPATYGDNPELAADEDKAWIDKHQPHAVIH